MICQLFLRNLMHDSHKSVQKQEVDTENNECNIRLHSPAQKDNNNKSCTDQLYEPQDIPYIFGGCAPHKHKFRYSGAVQLTERKQVQNCDQYIDSGGCIVSETVRSSRKQEICSAACRTHRKPDIPDVGFK